MKLKNSTVTVAIPCTDRPQELKKLLQSIRLARTSLETSGSLGLDATRGLEVLVVFSSSLGNEDAIVSICDDFGTGHIQGPASASGKRNLALEVSSREYVLFIDDDCWVSPTLFQEYFEVIARSSSDLRFGGAAGPVLFEECSAFAWRLVEYTATLSCFASPLVRTQLEWVPTANLLVNRDLALLIDGFDEDFPVGAGGEDVDFCLRIGDAGKYIAAVPKAIVHHTSRTWMSMSRNLKRFFDYGRAEVRLKRKYPRRRCADFRPCSISMVTALLISLLLVLVLGDIFLLLLFPLFVFLLGGFDFLLTFLLYRSFGESILRSLAKIYLVSYDFGFLYQSIRSRDVSDVLVGFRYYESPVHDAGELSRLYRVMKSSAVLSGLVFFVVLFIVVAR